MPTKIQPFQIDIDSFVDAGIATKEFVNSELEKTQSTQSFGSVAIFPFYSAPDGYVVIHGAEVSRKSYSRIFKKIGTSHGEGDGKTTFNLPDFRPLIDGLAGPCVICMKY